MTEKKTNRQIIYKIFFENKDIKYLFSQIIKNFKILLTKR